jgi:maltose O-acetyltransferase
MSTLCAVPDALEAALPPRLELGGGFRTRRNERKQLLKVARAFERATTPPPANQWGHYGRAFVVPPARISRPDCISIGDGVVVLENVWMSVVQAFDDVVPRLVFGNRVRVGRGCQLSVVGELVVEADALIGDFVQIGDTSHPYEPKLRMPVVDRPRPVRIGARAVIASHVVILPGVTIGAGAIVDHHAVVTTDVAPGAIVSGNPAVEVSR